MQTISERRAGNFGSSQQAGRFGGASDRFDIGEDPEYFKENSKGFEKLIKIIKSVKKAKGLPIMVSPGVVPDEVRRKQPMSTSLLYHAFGLKGVKYISTKYINGSVIFYAEVTSSIERCPVCNSLKTHRKKGMKSRLLKIIPIGARPCFLNVKIWRIFCEDCLSLRWPKLPFTEGKKRHTHRFAQFAIDQPRTQTL